MPRAGSGCGLRIDSLTAWTTSPRQGIVRSPVWIVLAPVSVIADALGASQHKRVVQKEADEMSPIASEPHAPSCLAVMRHALKPESRPLTVYAVSLPARAGHPFGEATFARREDAERFIEQIRRRNALLAAGLRVEVRQLDGGGPN